LKKYLFFFKKVLTFGGRDDIMSVATTKQLNTKTAPARRVAKSDHRQGIRVTRARVKQCAMKAENDNWQKGQGISLYPALSLPYLSAIA
jgi:hypothetical protein